MRGVFASLANLDAELYEHECFHELEDEEDYAPCGHTFSATKFVDGEERVRGKNGQ
jgi:hypothetical protein